MEWMVLPLKRYAEFSGRSRRKEYWMFVLFTVIAGVVLGLLDTMLGLNFGNATGRFQRDNGVLGSIFSLATLVPSIAVAVRRLHDTDRSGWWLLLPVLVVIALAALAISAMGSSSGGVGGLGVGFVIAGIAVLVSGLVLLIFFCLDGTRGLNRFGPDPKDAVGTAELGDVFA